MDSFLTLYLNELMALFGWIGAVDLKVEFCLLHQPAWAPLFRKISFLLEYLSALTSLGLHVVCSVWSIVWAWRWEVCWIGIRMYWSNLRILLILRRGPLLRPRLSLCPKLHVFSFPLAYFWDPHPHQPCIPPIPHRHLLIT